MKTKVHIARRLPLLPTVRRRRRKRAEGLDPSFSTCMPAADCRPSILLFVGSSKALCFFRFCCSSLFSYLPDCRDLRTWHQCLGLVDRIIQSHPIEKLKKTQSSEETSSAMRLIDRETLAVLFLWLSFSFAPIPLSDPEGWPGCIQGPLFPLYLYYGSIKSLVTPGQAGTMLVGDGHHHLPQTAPQQQQSKGGHRRAANPQGGSISPTTALAMPGLWRKLQVSKGVGCCAACGSRARAVAACAACLAVVYCGKKTRGGLGP